MLVSAPLPLLQGPAMPQIGDPALRPAECHAVITSTADMDAQAASLSELAAVVWLGATDPRFDYPHHRDIAAAAPGRFSYYSSDYGNLDIHIAKWRLNAHTDIVQANFHVHLCIENVPLNASNDAVAAQVLGPNTFLHYFDIASARCEDAATLNVWAWSADPSKIPKVLQATFTCNQPPATSAPNPAIGRQGLQRRVLIHMDLIEDFSPDADGSIPRRPRALPPLQWRLGVVDGESRSRDRLETDDLLGSRDDCDRRDGDCDRDGDHDDRGRRSDRRPSSWRGRLFRSRSRAPRREDRGSSPRDDRRRDDRHSRGRQDDDKRRHSASIPDARSVDVTKEQRLPDGAVIPAAGRRARHREAALEGRSRPCAPDGHVHTEDSRGRSPPPSPRTTSSDIIELRPSSASPVWLRRVAPCLASQVTPDAPPGWAGLSPQHHCSSLVLPSPRTPLHCPDPTADGAPAAIDTSLLTDGPECSPLFIARSPAILPTPCSTPPRPPVARRKTLAGVTGLHLVRNSPRLQAKNRDMPIALLAERLLCQRLGVVEEGEMITEAVISKFVALFRGQLLDIAVAALRALFRLDCDLASTVEEALLDHGGRPDQSFKTWEVRTQRRLPDAADRLSVDVSLFL
ncbi:hypothetical protein D1007_12467 [Hordeum vulgare]|nr:hypothetical protein D1007_12467 [Hordeum vulgare]